MLRHSGRAAAEIADICHRVVAFLLTVTVMLCVGVLGVAWRLSQGPLDLGHFKDRVEAAVNQSTDPVRVTIGGVSIAWGGFSHGLDQPLVLRITDLAVTEATGGSRVHIPVAEAALSARWMLIGRILPRAITLRGARLVLVRAADGTINLRLGDTADTTGPSPLSDMLAALGVPIETDRQANPKRLSQLSTVSVQAATLHIDDRLLGVTWTAERADIDLSRLRGGGVNGQATLVLSLEGQRAVLTGKFNMGRDARSVHVAARMSQVTPKALANAAPALASLAALDAPLTLDGEADLGPDLAPTHMRIIGRAGAGKINTESGSIPIRRAELIVAGTPDRATIESAVVEAQPAPGAAISTVGAGGLLTHAAGRRSARLHVTLDHAGFADLPMLWPEDIAADTRAWITRNITTGVARDGRFDLELERSDDDASVRLTRATGTMEGDDVSVAWLPTVPRVEQGKAHLVLTDPDKVEIEVKSARQRVNGGESLAILNGHVTVTGLAQKDQTATIRCEASGSIPSAIALLREPRLHILDKHPIDLRNPSGDVRMTLQVVVPLLKRLQFDDITIHGAGNLSKTHLTGIASGRDLDDGALALDVDTNHLSIKGTARLAGIPATIDAMMDFRAGPPSQVTQRYAVTGKATAAALAEAGLDTGDILTGETGVSLVMNEYRNGDGEITVEADLTQSVLAIAPLAWRKPAGSAAKASARATLSKDKLTGIDRLVIDGPGIQVRGSVTVAGGKLDLVRLERAVFGRNDVTGTIRWPHNTPIDIDLTGPALDISAKLLEKSPKREPGTKLPPGPAWTLHGRFDRVFLAHGQTAAPVAVSADNDGTTYRAMLITGKSGTGKPFSLQIGQGRIGSGKVSRRLSVTVEDAGGLLNGLDVNSSILGGTMSVAGEFNDSISEHTLSGTLDIVEFRVARAPVLGKLLQAVTFYGLVDALGGQGLHFSHLTAPFQLTDDALVLSDARAFSPSLGLTAKGVISRTGDRLDLTGTLVPAYVFNSLLGRIPLIGKLFSAEKGGGLFAMNYSLRGPTDNPSISANPLSALTPGILRGMFGMFDQEPTAKQPPPVR